MMKMMISEPAMVDNSWLILKNSWLYIELVYQNSWLIFGNAEEHDDQLTSNVWSSLFSN